MVLYEKKNHVLTAIVDAKPCAYLMALLTKTMRCTESTGTTPHLALQLPYQL